jgi:hypothetical protein
MSTKEVTTKNTKEEIFNAYQSTLNQLNAKESAKLDPVKVKTQKARQEVMEKAKVISTEGVVKSIETVRNRTQAALAQIEQETTERLNELKTVEEALAARQAEIQDIFGIEAQAGSLAALVEAQSERRAQFEKEQNDLRMKFNEDMALQRKNWEIQKAEYERTTRLMAEQDRLNRERELETHKYTFERDMKAKYDKLTDELNARAKQFENEMELRNKQYMEQMEQLAKREALQKDLENRVTLLEAEKNQLINTTQSKIDTAVEQAKKSAATGYAIEVNSLKKTHEAEVMVLNGRVTDLQSRYNEMRDQNTQLTNKLESAYSKVQSVAEKALDAQGNRETVAAVRQMSETSSQKR